MVNDYMDPLSKLKFLMLSSHCYIFELKIYIIITIYMHVKVNEYYEFVLCIIYLKLISILIYISRDDVSVIESHCICLAHMNTTEMMGEACILNETSCFISAG